MKIAVTGKGGVGKTTFAATLARLYADEGKKVLAADVDPDANLGLALGFDEETLDSIVPISKMRKLIEERTGANSQNQFYKLAAELAKDAGLQINQLPVVLRSPAAGSYQPSEHHDA